MFRTCAAFSLAAAVGVITLGSDAMAQANCAEYGRLALKQQKENEAGKCGFSGPEWSPDLKAHVSWCQTVGPDKWKEQLQMRAQTLAGCKK